MAVVFGGLTVHNKSTARENIAGICYRDLQGSVRSQSINLNVICQCVAEQTTDGVPGYYFFPVAGSFLQNENVNRRSIERAYELCIR